MAILSKGTTLATGDQVTASRLNSLVDNATFASGAVDNSTTALDGSGRIIVKDGGITTAKLDLVSGNLGIGTNTANSKLEVVGDILVDNGLSNGGRLKMASSGNVTMSIVNRPGGIAFVNESTQEEVLEVHRTKGLSVFGTEQDDHAYLSLVTHGASDTSLIECKATPTALFSAGQIRYYHGVDALSFTVNYQSPGLAADLDDVVINSDGDLMVGRGVFGKDIDSQSPGCVFRKNGEMISAKGPDNGGTHISFVNNADSYLIRTIGSITSTSTITSYNETSDYRLKTDLQPIVGATERVQQLKPVDFLWESDGTRMDGFIAHEAQEVVPWSVTGTKDAVDEDGKPVYQGIDTGKLVPLLTKALQEALTKIESLEARVAALES